MREMFDTLIGGFWESPRQAIRDILGLLAIVFLAVLLYAVTLPEPTRQPELWNQYKSSVVRGH